MNELFNSQTPMSMLDDATSFLTSCANSRWRPGSHFDKFFDLGDQSSFDSPNDLEHNDEAKMKLIELEEQMK